MGSIQFFKKYTVAEFTKEVPSRELDPRVFEVWISYEPKHRNLIPIP